MSEAGLRRSASLRNQAPILGSSWCGTAASLV